nr:microtubule-associated protein futsch [Nothobranchius furzeri]
MDKRTDLASLFCMVGRHGPAVAVAVIAVVSVVAGLIIYRTVRGKRRKAAAGAVDRSSRRHASLSDPEPEPSLEASRSRQKSTELDEDDQLDVEEVKVTRSPYNLRNRRVAAKKPSISPQRELEPEKKVDTSPMLDFSSVAETCVTEETTKDAEDQICFKHVVECDNKKVSRSQEVEVATKDVENKCCKNSSLSQSDDDAQEHRSTPETINIESSLKELIKSLDDMPTSCKDSLAYDQKFYHEKGSELLKTVPGLNLSVDSETTQEQVQSAAQTDLPSTPLQTEKEDEDAVVSKLTESVGLSGLKCNGEGLKSSSEMDSDVVVFEKSEDSVSSSYRGLETAVNEPPSSSAPLTSADMVNPDMSSFQRKESDQTDMSEDLSEVSSAAVPDMDEGIKAQSCHIHLLSCDQSELTWSSSAVGEESGISSMTVSPDLPEVDTEDDCLVLSVADPYPDSEEHIEAQGTFSDAQSVNHDSLVKTVTSSSLDLSQQASTEVKENVSITNEFMFSQETKEVDQFAIQISTGYANLTELGETEVKLAVESEGDKTTEISIMEATMDNNEWITDGNVQVLPWMGLYTASVHYSKQPDKVSSEPPSLVPSNSPCRNTDSVPSIEVTQTNTLLDGNDKDIVAVQPMPQNVNVTFRIHYLTHSPYQKVAIMGNMQELGNWKEFILLEKANDGHWSTVVSLPTESHVEWKFVVVDKDEVCRWEECGNRLLDTGYDDLLVHKWWGFM